MAKFKIRFSYDGKRYSVGGEAYDLNKIVLPDGRLIIAAGGWLESMPPKPVGLREINHLFQTMAPDEIAKHLNGVLAVEMGPCKVRVDWLVEHVAFHPWWYKVVPHLITDNCFVVIPAKYGWRDGNVDDKDLLVLERGVKGPPAAFRIYHGDEKDTIECVNYPGSYKPMSINEWLKYVHGIVAQSDPMDEWIQNSLDD